MNLVIKVRRALDIVFCFVVLFIVIIFWFNLGSYIYALFVGKDINYGFCQSSDGCLVVFILIQLPVIIFLAILFTILVKACGWKKGCIYSLAILIIILIFMMFVSGRAEYYQDREYLDDAIYSLNELDKKINKVAQDKSLIECFTEFPKIYGPYYMEPGYLPNPDGPIIPSRKTDDRVFYIKGNGITVLTDYNRFKLFKIMGDKTINSVHVSIRPIVFKEEYNKNILEEDKKYIFYAYLDYKNMIELIIREKELSRAEFFNGKCSSRIQIENGGYNEQGTPVVFYTKLNPLTEN